MSELCGIHIQVCIFRNKTFECELCTCPLYSFNKNIGFSIKCTKLSPQN